jgi:hypothetical protein
MTTLNEWSARCKVIYLHRTTQHIKTSTNIHVLSGIRTHDLSVQAVKSCTSDRAATGTGLNVLVALFTYLRNIYSYNRILTPSFPISNYMLQILYSVFI